MSGDISGSVAAAEITGESFGQNFECDCFHRPKKPRLRRKLDHFQRPRASFPDGKGPGFGFEIIDEFCNRVLPGLMGVFRQRCVWILGACKSNLREVSISLRHDE
jgi:hypothetical protein